MKKQQTLIGSVVASALILSVLGFILRSFEKPSAYAFVDECAPTFNMPCSSVNACGESMPGTFNCQGVCSAPTPPLPPMYGMSCVATGPANVCGDFDIANGTYQCNSSCSAAAPLPPKREDTNENDIADCLETQGQATPPTPPTGGGGGGGISPTYVPTPTPSQTPSQPTVVAQNRQITPPFTDLLITGPSEEEEQPELPSVLPKTGADAGENK